VRDIDITAGPWPPTVTQKLIELGIMRLQHVRLLYATEPQTLTARVPGTTDELWREWLAELPEPAVDVQPRRAMGLMPKRADQQPELNHEGTDDGHENGKSVT